MHEYNLTPHSLYAAVSVGLDTNTIVSVLNKLSKTKLPQEMIDFIHASTANYGKVKLVLKKNRYFIESPYPEVLKKLLKDEVIGKSRIVPENARGNDVFVVNKTLLETGSSHDGFLNEDELAAAAEDKETHSFEIDPSQVESVKQRCLPNALNYPMLEEYDFRNDTVNPSLFVNIILVKHIHIDMGPVRCKPVDCRLANWNWRLNRWFLGQPNFFLGWPIYILILYVSRCKNRRFLKKNCLGFKKKKSINTKPHFSIFHNKPTHHLFSTTALIIILQSLIFPNPHSLISNYYYHT